MSSDDDAEVWMQARLTEVRSSYAGDHQPQMSLANYERQLRGMIAAATRPVAHYVGLKLHEAEGLADQEGRRLCVHRGPTGHRANWRSDRVHLEVAPEGQVLAAWPDTPFWTQRSDEADRE